MQEALDMGSFGPFGHIYKREISRIYAIAALSYARANRPAEANEYINKAIKEIQEVTKENPRNQNVYRVAAATYFELGQLDPRYTQAGIEMMLKAQELGPTFPDMPMSIASVYISIGDKDNALKYIDRVLELQDNYPNALITKIGLLYDMNRSTEANKILSDFMAGNKQFNPQDNLEGLKQVLAKANQNDMLNKLNNYLAKQASTGAAAK
jgi:tetratricopeptide (TPR) repeat protein